MTRLLQRQEDLKYIIVIPHISMAEKMRLPNAPCLFAIVEYRGGEEPDVLFYSEEAVKREQKICI